MANHGYYGGYNDIEAQDDSDSVDFEYMDKFYENYTYRRYKRIAYDCIRDTIKYMLIILYLLYTLLFSLFCVGISAFFYDNTKNNTCDNSDYVLDKQTILIVTGFFRIFIHLLLIVVMTEFFKREKWSNMSDLKCVSYTILCLFAIGLTVSSICIHMTMHCVCHSEKIIDISFIIVSYTDTIIYSIGILCAIILYVIKHICVK